MSDTVRIVRVECPGFVVKITRTKWKLQQSYCYICQRRDKPLECHEIARGNHKQRAMLVPATWISTCRDCHRDHLDGMSIAKQLAYKAIHDPEWYDRQAVNVCRCQQPEAVTEFEVQAEIKRIKAEGVKALEPFWQTLDRERNRK